MVMIASIDARTGATVEEIADETTPSALDALAAQAARAADALEQLGRRGRAQMLVAMADALEADREEIVALADRETALGVARLGGELTRTCFQLRFFAEVIGDGGYLEAIIDHAGDTAMGPRPDLRRILEPLGPVAVFGASNFPLAFSVPGGDTASALAAGCPVLVKVHGAHPATARRCGAALADGARAVGLDEGVVSLVFGDDAGVALVRHEAVRAVGFTGSLAGGRFLAQVAAERPAPIPFYGELGALNAVVVAPGAAAARADEIGAGLSASFSLGVGQFCTKPGLAFVPSGADGDRLGAALVRAAGALGPAPMLTAGIAAHYRSGTEALRALPGVRAVAEAATVGAESWGGPLVLEAEATALEGALLEECFGPVLALVRYGDAAELRALLARLSPALTATVHAEEGDAAFVAPVLDDLRRRVGRIVWNGYPTGVAVSWAMHHGGPFPATTDPLHTSVGATAIRRWLRPVAYQNVPAALLPPELTDDPPAGHRVARRVDGVLELPAR